MNPHDDDLAARMKAAIDAEIGQQATTRSASGRIAIDAEVARTALFGRLREFAERIGHIEARSDDDALVLAWRDRGVRFTADGRGVVVQPEGMPGAEASRAWPEAELEGRWVLLFRRHAREEQMPLFDRGLEELLVTWLGLPRPESVERPMSARTAAALTRPTDAAAAGGDAPSEERPRTSAAAPAEPTAPRKRTL